MKIDITCTKYEEKHFLRNTKNVNQTLHDDATIDAMGLP